MLEKLLETGRTFLRAGLLSLAFALPTQAQKTTEIIPDSKGNWNLDQPVALWHYDSGSMTYSLGEIANLTISGNANTNGETIINYSLMGGKSQTKTSLEEEFSKASFVQNLFYLGVFTRGETAITENFQLGTMLKRNSFTGKTTLYEEHLNPVESITNFVTGLQKLTLKATDKYVNKPIEEYTGGLIKISAQEITKDFFENQNLKEAKESAPSPDLSFTKAQLHSHGSQVPVEEKGRYIRLKLSNNTDASLYLKGHLANPAGDEADFRIIIPIIQRPTSEEPDGFYENTDKNSDMLGIVVHSGHIYFIPRNEEMKLPIVRSPDGRPFLKYKNTRAETDPEWKNISKEFLLPLQSEGNQLKIPSTPAIKRIIPLDMIQACRAGRVKIPDETRTEIGLEGTLEKID